MRAAPFPPSTSRPSRPPSTSRWSSTAATRPSPTAPSISDTPGPGDGKHTLKFLTTPKMSTYLVAFLVGDFQCTAGESDGVAIRVCATPDKVALTPYGARRRQVRAALLQQLLRHSLPAQEARPDRACPTSKPAPWKTSAPSPTAKPTCSSIPKPPPSTPRKKWPSSSPTRWPTSGSATWSPCSGGTTSGSTRALPPGWRTSPSPPCIRSGTSTR